jgi:hypothetical protein
MALDYWRQLGYRKKMKIFSKFFISNFCLEYPIKKNEPVEYFKLKNKYFKLPGYKNPTIYRTIKRFDKQATLVLAEKVPFRRPKLILRCKNKQRIVAQH